MAETPTTIDIDGFSYLVPRLPPRRALRLEARLVRLLGPGIVELLLRTPTRADGRADLGAVDLSQVGPAVQAVLAQLTPDEQDAIMAELLEPVRVVGQDGKLGPVMPIFDSHFDGRLPAVFKLMWASLEVQFGGFFELFASAARAVVGAARVSRASTTSGPSSPSGGSS